MANSPTIDALYRIKRGLAGYVSYLAACEMNESFSEYVLYEPALRILTARGFTVKCEVPCPGYVKVGRGDFKKIDYVAELRRDAFAVEMKWAQKARIDVAADVEKLTRFIASGVRQRGFLCVFGRRNHIEGLVMQPVPGPEQGKGIYADFGVTRYGCRVFEVRRNARRIGSRRQSSNSGSR